MAARDVIVVGGSAGAFPALAALLSALPPAFPAAVLVVVHTRADGEGGLPGVLQRSCPLSVASAVDGERLEPGRVYVAPPDLHLVVTLEGLGLVQGPKENGFRPAIDPLFRSAATVYGPRVVGVLLSGALDDGSYGLDVIKQRGGVAVVQDPEDAEVPSMPLAALRDVMVDYVLPAAEIGALLERLTAEPIAAREEPMGLDERPEPRGEQRVASTVRTMESRLGASSALTCPDCGGALWELQRGRVLRYACHVGHQFAPASLAAEQRESIESALWAAIRALEEHAELRLRMARRSTSAGLSLISQDFEDGAYRAHQQAQQLRDLLASRRDTGSETNGPPAAVRRRSGRKRRVQRR